MISVKIANFSRLAAPLGLYSARSLTSAMALRAAATTNVQQIKQLKDKIKKEKAVLKDLTTRHKETVKKHKLLQKDREAKDKSKAKEKKLLEQAFKPYRSISGFNVYVKEQVTPERSFSEVAPLWNTLSDSEKQAYKRKADEINERQLKIYTPKPKRPVNGYASFIKENWFDGDSNTSVMKELSVQWKQLSESEKNAYKPDAATFDKYTRDLKAWKEHRLKVFREHGAPQN
ncbi:hypothetical protein ACI3LY_000786 [Candidozyma auris]|uniref:HMG box domain-containing protein n=2 Tax=Candidozyma auris TaxID=498019 RepID=A0A2H1A7F5_CANAR|nr:hypothetical protein QG37_02516 [[Candida] auris]PIS58814.1 hypothetical protein B9J08_000268 [[Candida] auris]QWW23128.1 hypothetical protein CA7LBN_001929 [[Candida] auris]